jgi:hypothetical protein
MNLNYAAQHQGLLAWAGSSGTPIDIRRHVGISFTFEVTLDLVADAVFFLRAAPPSDADPCLPGPLVAVPEVPTCIVDDNFQPAVETTIAIPGGTKKGSICTAGLPCKPDAFVQLVSSTGPTVNVRAVAILSGPK